ILPCQLFLRRLAQKIGRVQPGDRSDFLTGRRIAEPAPTQTHDALLAAEQGLRRRRAEADENFGVHERDLAACEGQAAPRFQRGRRAVSRRPPGTPPTTPPGTPPTFIMMSTASS